MEITKEMLQKELDELNALRKKHLETIQNSKRNIDMIDGALQLCQGLIYKLDWPDSIQEVNT